MSNETTGEKQTPNPEETQNQQQTETKTEKVSFTADQQAKVNELIDAKFGDGYNKAKKELATEIETLKSQIEQLKKPAEAKPEGKDEKSGKTAAQDDEVARMRAQLEELRTISEQLKADKTKVEDELKTVTTRTRDTRKKETFLDAAKEHNFFDSLEVFRLVQDEIDLDETGQVYVKNLRTGSPRLNGNLEPMTVKELLAEFAKGRPYMVRASAGDGGAGSKAADRVDTTTTTKVPDVSKMTAEEFEAVRSQFLNR